jgi:hypothetical protein
VALRATHRAATTLGAAMSPLHRDESACKCSWANVRDGSFIGYGVSYVRARREHVHGPRMKEHSLAVIVGLCDMLLFVRGHDGAEEVGPSQ